MLHPIRVITYDDNYKGHDEIVKFYLFGEKYQFMAEDTRSFIINSLKDVFGKSLRGVRQLEDCYRRIYLRNDIKTEYTSEEIEKMIDEYRAEHLESRHLESVWSAGKHQCTIYAFEEAIHCHCIKDDKELIFSFDRDVDVSINRIIELSIKILDELPKYSSD